MLSKVCGRLHPGPRPEVRGAVEYIPCTLTEKQFFVSKNQPAQEMRCFQRKTLYFSSCYESSERKGDTERKIGGNQANNWGKRHMLEGCGGILARGKQKERKN